MEGQDQPAFGGEERRPVAGHFSGPPSLLRRSVRGDDRFDWEQSVRILKKNCRLSLVFALGVVLSVVFVSFGMKDIYEPTARVEIDPPGTGLLESHQREPGNEIGPDYLETQARILKSDSLALAVIRTLHLDQRPEIVGEKAVSQQERRRETEPSPPATGKHTGPEQPASSRAAGPEDAVPPKSARASSIESVKARRAGDHTQVLVRGNGALTYALDRSLLPGRLTLDFAGVHLQAQANLKEQHAEEALPWMRQVRVGQFRPDVARVVIDLSEPAAFELWPVDHGVMIELSAPNSRARAAAPSPSQQAAAIETAGAPAAESVTPSDAIAGKPGAGQPLHLDERNTLEEAALRYFQRNLTVTTSRNSRLVEVSFASSNARLAADTTNALVTHFIDSDYRTRYETTMRASNWLSEQLSDLRQKVRDTNQALAEYQKRFGIVDPGERDNPLLQKAGELNRQLSQAQADRIQLEAYARMAESGSADSLPQIRDNLLIQSLTQKTVESRAQLARALVIYGENNSNVKRLRGETDELNAQLESEKKAVLRGLETSYRASVTREQLMGRAVEQVKTAVGEMDEKMVQYRLLKNEAQASSELFNTLLARLKEAGVYAGLRSSNIRVVDLAAVPDRPARPHRVLDIAIGLLAALVGGAGLAFFKEALNNKVRTPDDVMRWTGLPSLPMIPEISLANGRGPKLRPTGAALHLSRDGNYSQTIAGRPRLHSPGSLTPEADAMNNLRTSILLSRAAVPRVFLVAASCSGEGSTTVAANLAISLARRGKTCLVDGDLRMPAVAGAFAVVPAAGLSNVLAGEATVEQALSAVSRSGNLSILAGGPTPPNPADLLTAETMRKLIHMLRRQFEFVVIDSPPVIPFPDARILSSLADGVILVSRCGLTTRRAILRSAELLGEVHAPLLGVIINGVNLNSPDYRYYTYGFGNGAQRDDSYRYQAASSQVSNNGRKRNSNGH